MFDSPQAEDYVATPYYEGKERRRFPRYNYKVKIKYELGNEYNIHSTINISQGGVLIKSKTSIPVDSHILVRVELPGTGDDVIIIARAVRVEQLYDENVYLIALCFSIMDAKDGVKLARFISTIGNK